MLICKECGRSIRGKGKTGLCNSCVHKIKNLKTAKNRHCIICGASITDYNKSSLCQEHWHGKGGNTNVAGQPMSRNGRWVHDSYFSNAAD